MSFYMHFLLESLHLTGDFQFNYLLYFRPGVRHKSSCRLVLPQLDCLQSHLSPQASKQFFLLVLSVGLQIFWLPPREGTCYTIIHWTHTHEVVTACKQRLPSLCAVCSDLPFLFRNVLISAPLAASSLKNTALDNLLRPSPQWLFVFSALISGHFSPFLQTPGPPALQGEPLGCNFAAHCQHASLCIGTSVH